MHALLLSKFFLIFSCNLIGSFILDLLNFQFIILSSRDQCQEIQNCQRIHVTLYVLHVFAKMPQRNLLNV